MKIWKIEFNGELIAKDTNSPKEDFMKMDKEDLVGIIEKYSKITEFESGFYYIRDLRNGSESSLDYINGKPIYDEGNAWEIFKAKIKRITINDPLSGSVYALCKNGKKDNNEICAIVYKRGTEPVYGSEKEELYDKIDVPKYVCYLDTKTYEPVFEYTPFTYYGVLCYWINIATETFELDRDFLDSFKTMKEAENFIRQEINENYINDRRNGIVSYYEIIKYQKSEEGTHNGEPQKTICGFSKEESVAQDFYSSEREYYTPNEKYLEFLDKYKNHNIYSVESQTEGRDIATIGDFRLDYFYSVCGMVIFSFKNDKTMDVLYYTIDTIPYDVEQTLWKNITKKVEELSKIL